MMSQTPASFQSVLSMEESNMQPDQPQQIPVDAPPQKSVPRKRKKDNRDEQSSNEPRRLRRSHEACARCRMKKIKCDSKHPRCSACTAAGSECQQEDRHRQLLTPRGYSDHIGFQLRQCDALLKRHITGFSLENLTEILASEGIEVDPNGPPLPIPTLPAGFQFQHQGPPPGFLPEDAAKVYPYPPHMPPMPGYMYPPAMYPPALMSVYNPHLHPVYAHHPPVTALPATQPPVVAAERPNELKGTDPQSNDLSTSAAIVKSFGITEEFLKRINTTEPTVPATEKEDIAVGSGGLTSGREREAEILTRKPDPKKWVKIVVRRPSLVSSPEEEHIDMPTSAKVHQLEVEEKTVWLPRDRSMMRRIVEVYFTRLNMHRPVFTRSEFERDLEALFEDSANKPYDPGFVCSLYLVLALGTLSELNHRAVDNDGAASESSLMTPLDTAHLMPPDWPEYTEFFNQAMTVKPDLRITISSLQALILLQWYLYTERQGRSLWRLVGSLVRMAIELGLHHDPHPQVSKGKGPDKPTFSADECKLRIRLWGIIMVHDRGTSLLLGRPLGISPSDTNTPHPPISRVMSTYPVSENFLLSHEIAEIQADIINSLYTPQELTRQIIMRQTGRILNRMNAFRAQLPQTYHYYFSGTGDWSMDERVHLVKRITEDEGLTLLKIGITRILLLRAVFNFKQLTLDQRARALKDAVITSHNVIIVHNQLIRFPDIGCFTSPIPLHIAAMVILYGRIAFSRDNDPLTDQQRIEDLWLALAMIPKFRWRWERKDFRGEHPLIAKIASAVTGQNLHNVRPTGAPVLIPEPEWINITEELSSPDIVKMQPETPTLSARTLDSASPTRDGTTSSRTLGTPEDSTHGHSPRSFDAVPPQMFYPFYPEMVEGGNAPSSNGAPIEVASFVQSGVYHPVFANQVVQSSFGCQPSESFYVSEELDTLNSSQNGWDARFVQ